jgi:hypothetical protein
MISAQAQPSLWKLLLVFAAVGPPVGAMVLFSWGMANEPPQGLPPEALSWLLLIVVMSYALAMLPALANGLILWGLLRTFPSLVRHRTATSMLAMIVGALCAWAWFETLAESRVVIRYTLAGAMAGGLCTWLSLRNPGSAFRTG